MLQAVVVSDAEQASVLGRTSPLVKLGIAVLWLLGLATTTQPVPGFILAATALLGGLGLGGLTPARLSRPFLPILLAAGGIALANLLFSQSNPDPAMAEVLRLGPLRITAAAVSAAAGVGARVLAIASVGAVFTFTTDATRLVDALVQQGRVSPRFAYGALAAYRAVPGLAEDFATLRGARRLRGLPAWHPWVLVGLLVRAIRHADQLALAMDARAFGTGPRSTYRPIHWGPLDAIVGGGGLAVLVVALLAAR
jgi:energy-coupling factor transport system permease protein